MSDPYSDASRLVDELRARGLESWASQVEDTLSAGATATEILMTLRWVLQRLISELDSDDGLTSHARLLLQTINILLR